MTKIQWTDETANNNRLREKNNNWKGGRLIASNGYVLIRVGVGHHLADVRGYAYEHRIVAEQKIGRRLKKKEQVHHINHDKQDNRPDNLEVYSSNAYHQLQHRSPMSLRREPQEPNPLIECCCGCGKTFGKFDKSGRPRRFISGHNSVQYQKEIENCFLSSLKSDWISIDKISLISGKPIHSLRLAANRLRKEGIIVLFKNRFFHKDFPPEQYINPYVQCKCGCKEELRKFDSSMRAREFISGHNGRKNKNV